ncbi:hypothetical protein Btru_054176 [Bulinus truncatus]|nr:hypothetical protein Btru_054176 [Bulinus truncatus]
MTCQQPPYTLVSSSNGVTRLFQESHISTMTSTVITANHSSALGVQTPLTTLASLPSSSFESSTLAQISASPVTTDFPIVPSTALQLSSVSYADNVINSTQFSTTALLYSSPVSAITQMPTTSFGLSSPISLTVVGSTSQVNNVILSQTLSSHSTLSAVPDPSPSLPEQIFNLNIKSSVTSSADTSLSDLSTTSVTPYSMHASGTLIPSIQEISVASSSGSTNVWHTTQELPHLTQELPHLTQELPHLNASLDSLTTTHVSLNSVTSTQTTDSIETTVVSNYQNSTVSFDTSTVTLDVRVTTHDNTKANITDNWNTTGSTTDNWITTKEVHYDNSTSFWDSGNTTMEIAYDNSTSASTDIWNATQETPYNTTKIMDIWNATQETPYNTTKIMDIWNATQDMPYNTTDITDIWNTTQELPYNTTDVTDIWNTTQEMPYNTTNTTTQEATTTTSTETTTPTTTTKTTPILTTIKTTTRSSAFTTSTKSTLTTTTEVPIHEYALTVPVIIGITVGLIVLTALIFIMLLWRRHVKQDHSVNVPRRYSVNSTKASSFKHRSLYGQMSHERHPSFAPVYYGEAGQSQPHRPVRMSSYKIKDGSGQPPISNFDEIKKNSGESVKRVDEEVIKEKVKERHSYPYEKRKLKPKLSLSIKGLNDVSNKDRDAVKVNGDINSHELNPPTTKMNGFHDSCSESVMLPPSLEDTRL